MRIHAVEVANFRKLLSVRIDFGETRTLFVGANNSGKTTAMLALRRFLKRGGGERISVYDFTLVHWDTINRIGQRWLSEKASEEANGMTEWTACLPALDVWIHVNDGEAHLVNHLLPVLDWHGPLLGVRLRYEPKDVNDLKSQFLAAVENANRLRNTAPATNASSPAPKVNLWPSNLIEFLERKAPSTFCIRAYLLDPKGLVETKDGQAQPQRLTANSVPLEGHPLASLIRVDDIDAQRGFGSTDDSAHSGTTTAKTSRLLSEQLRSYYRMHLNAATPDAADLAAMEAMTSAQTAFDERLKESFKSAFLEVQGLGYPGLTDPKIRIATRVKLIDGLNHDTAVSFELDVSEKKTAGAPELRIPEGHNGLGYQNLISMVFRLMSFREEWLLGAGESGEDGAIPPLHLVLVEEPEAHLHAQVQQVFMNKAYSVLRSHRALGNDPTLCTQVVVSTHSSHVAHETPFSNLRYFRRLPAGMAAEIPVSSVINLSSVFGDGDETERFVARYLRAHHADLFFADAAILVEGAAERILVPHFIRHRYSTLAQSYLSLLEIGGSHAHRLRALLEQLGLLTLIITDIDAVTGKTASAPCMGMGQTTSNQTLRTWLPGFDSIDSLLGATEAEKTLVKDHLASIRVAYQTAVLVELSNGQSAPLIGSTFEDALAVENLKFFGETTAGGIAGGFRDAITNAADDAEALCSGLFTAVRGSRNKAELALHLIDEAHFDQIKVPTYVAEGLQWLETQLLRKQCDEVAIPKPRTGDEGFATV